MGAAKRPKKSVPKESWVTDFYLRGYEGQGCRALLYGSDDALLAYPWEEARKELLPEWIREHPGTRPYAWWEKDAPEPRRRVGGSGRRARNALIKFGVPSDNWFKDVDPGRPPLYESQAAYLQRHNLLTVAEKRWLADHPEALEPEVIGYRLSTGPEIYCVGYSGPGYYEDRDNI
jgi:hypothetical protein